jgi:hypothetical protein
MKTVPDLQSRLPTPTKEDPHRQLDWIFRDKISLYANEDTQTNYTTALSFYKRFLKHTHNYSAILELDPRFYLKQEWDVFALHKVRQWIDTTNITGCEDYLTSHSLTGIVSALRQTMEHAYEHSYIEKPVINVIMPAAVRETDVRVAYSVEEYERIFKVLSPQIKFSRGLLQPYIPTGLGRDPRGRTSGGLSPDHKPLGHGWNCWAAIEDEQLLVPQEDNLRWYFENKMNCVPLPATRENIAHQGFFRTAKLNYGGLRELYRKWGLSSNIDTDVIMPLVVELIAETGLNVESLLSLKRDCFKDAHPLTGLPYLDYNKPRSGGDKELHLSLYDADRNQMGLKQGQSRVISNSIKTILQLTESLIGQAAESDREYLFLSQRRHRTAAGQVGRVERVGLKIARHWLAKIVKNYDLRGDDGRPLVFNLSRFRPTKITEMVSQGYDFFDIMAIAGHASINTTLSYIDKLRSAGDFHRKIEKALTTIKENKREYERDPLPIAITRVANPNEFIFKGPVCHCKNPYDPPEVVRKNGTYHEGDACSYWNMCLQCDNVLITEMNLPKLIAYRNEIEQSLFNVNEIPVLGELYKKMRMILDAILIPDELFSKASLDWATQVAQTMDFEVLDTFISRSTEA